MMITKYCDFVLVVDREGNNESNVRQLSVRVLESPAGESQTEIVAISLDLKKEVRKLERRDLDTASIIVLGEKLGNLLLPNQARKLFINSLHQLQSDEGLRLRLKLEPSLASIPWEYLYIPDLSGGKRDSTGFCALHPKISLVRHELVSIPVQLNTSPKVRRLLVALASPQDKGLLDIAKERENIESALKDIPGIKAEFLENATAEGLSEQLIPGTDIFHFAGHGEFKISELDTRRGFISLLGEDGKAALMSAEQLAMNLRDRGVQLVVLGACNTGQRDEQSAWDGVVAALIRVGIPAAVAMQYKIWDKSAIAFSRSFYKALATGLTLDQAVAAGRLAVFNLCESLPEEQKQQYWRDWGVPVLYWRGEGNFILPAIDVVGRDKLATGNIENSAVAIGTGASATSNNYNINNYNYSPPYPQWPNQRTLELALTAVSADLERVSSELSEEKAAKLEKIRELDRKGQVRTAYERTKALRQGENWRIYTPTLQAQILRMLARYAIAIDNNPEKARELADEARHLDPNADDTFIRTLICYCVTGAEAALTKLGTTSDINIFNLKLALLLEIDRSKDAVAELQAIPENLSPNAITKQIHALALLREGDLAGAQKQIQEAVTTSPAWFYVREAEAIVNYYSALSPAALPRHLVPWPSPVSSSLVKCDNQSLACLRKAEAEFKQLSEQTQKDDEQRQLLEIWRLACLAIDPDRQNQARDFCRSLLAADPSNPRVLIWALLRNYDVDLPICEKVLEESVNSSQSDCERIIVLVVIYLTTGKSKQAIAFLESVQVQFECQNGADLWRFWYIQALVADGDFDRAFVTSDIINDSYLQGHSQINILADIARQSNNWQPLIEHLENLFKQTKNSYYLYECCYIKAYSKDWDYVADRASELIDKVKTFDALLLAVNGSWQAKRPKQCFDLLNEHQTFFADTILPDNLLHIRVHCQAQLGLLPQAVAEAEDMLSKRNTMENLLTLMELQLRQGDRRKFAIMANRLLHRPDVQPINLLWAARFTQLEDRELARKLWQKAVKDPVENPEILGLVIDLGYRLGFDREMGQFVRQAQSLALEGKGPFHAVEISKFLSWMQHWTEQQQLLNQKYESGEIPVHLLTEAIKIPLVSILYHLSKQNSAEPNPRFQPAIFARHGGRSVQEQLTASHSQWRLHLDVSALLLAAHLDILDLVEQRFQPLRISPAIPIALLGQSDKLTHHQPSSLEVERQILKLFEARKLCETPRQLNPANDKSELIQKMGWQWTGLLEKAKAENAYIVDYLPLTSNNFEMQPVILSESERERVINCRTLVEALKNRLSTKDYQSTLESLGSEGNKEIISPLPTINASIYLVGNIASVLASAKILDKICKIFTVFVDYSYIDKARFAVQQYEHRSESLAWLSSLIDRVRDGLERGVYEAIALSDERRPPDLEEDEVNNPDLLTILDLLRFAPQPGDIIWTDDRYFNSYIHWNGVPIVSILEILTVLRQQDAIDEADYYRHLLQLRQANIRYLPITREEIFYQLRQASVIEGSIQETEELSTMRRYMASCLLDSHRLQRPPLLPDAPNPEGEIAFLVDFLNAVSDALVGIWAKEEITDEIATAQANWIWENLYVGSFGLRHFLPATNFDSEAVALIGLDIGKAYFKGISLPINIINRESENSSPRKKYFNWLEHRMARQRFKVDPDAIIASAQTIHYLFASLSASIRQEHRNNAEQERAQIILSQFYLDLPKSIRREIRFDSDLISWLGIQSGESVYIGPAIFAASNFFQAAKEAINGRASKIVAVQPQVEFTIKQPEANNSSEITLEVKDEQNGNSYELNDSLLYLLSDNPARREEVLRSQTEWFDCDRQTFDRIVSEILSEPDSHRRFQRGQEWRDASAAFFYATLEQKINSREQFSFDELIPPSAEGLLRHFRLDRSIGDEKSFSAKLTEAARTLLEEEGLEFALKRMACLPVKLPDVLTEELGKLSSNERQNLLNQLASQWASPMCKLHLIDLILKYASDGESIIDLAQRTLNELCSETDGTVQFRLYKAILNWVNNEFAYWAESKKWPAPIKLAMIWAHSTKIQNLFYVLNIQQKEYLAQSFQDYTRSWQLASTEIFDRNPLFWNDVLHPRLLSRPELVVNGLAAAIIDKNLELLKDSGLIERVRQCAMTICNSPDERTNILLFHDPLLMKNSIGSFIGCDRERVLNVLFGSEKGENFSSDNPRAIVEGALEALARDPHSKTNWFKLIAFVGDFSIYDSLKDNLSSLLGQTNFVSILKNDIDTALFALDVASSQIAYLNDDNTRSRLKDEVVQIAQLLDEQKKEADDTITIQLIEILIRLALELNDPNQTIRTFTSLFERLLYAWPRLADTSIYGLTFRLAQELPARQLEGWWQAILSLRALRTHQ
jgi:hypothetical protein